MRISNVSVGLGLVTLSGCLWFLACTPFDLSALAWVAAVPMLLAVDRAPTYGRALLLGWWAGVIETGGGFYWLIDLMQRFAHFPWLAAAGVFFLFCAARALIFLLFTAIVYRIRRRRRVPMALLAALVMPACEFVVPQIFPCGQWISQAWHPLVIQLSELTGPLGVTALLMMVNGALYDLALEERGARPALLASAAILGAALAYGALRMQEVDRLIAAAPTLKVGLVQPNFPYTIDGEFSPAEARRQLAALQEQTRRLERSGAELVVWSEGSYPVALPRDLKADFAPESATMIRRGIGVPLIIGAVTYDKTLDSAFNTALALDEQGRITGRYDKVRLLAFGEYIPGVALLPWLKTLIPAGAGGFTAGAGPTLLPVKGPQGQPWAVAPVICYEDILYDYLRGVARLHPDLLVNLTSDSWFGAHSEPFEHLALAVFASVEMRTAMVRSVNSGVSALIDPNGRLLRKTYADDPYREPRAADGMLVSAPRLRAADTPYVRFGDWFAYLSMLVLLALFGLDLKASRAARSPSPDAGGAPRR